ncbi:phosphotransferase [Shewanella marina]|uniref:phosphotransferase n=1 Tax=Shewanella marina TaxID=487319 RepID=UPI000471EDA8|nr:phosphotransferase [Shewanella marina]
MSLTAYKKQALAKAIAPAKLGAVLDISLMSGGLSNHNYMVETRKGRWAVRHNSDASNTICNRPSEVANWLLAEQVGIAPKLVWVSEHQHYYVSRFIKQTRPWKKLNCESQEPYYWPGAERLLLDLLLKLQQLPLPDNVFSMFGQFQAYQQQLQRLAVLNQHSRWQHAYQELQELDAQVRAGLTGLQACLIKPQYCHRDLNSNNLLFSKQQLYCIDFEYACASHPLYELAVVLCSHQLSTNQQQWLIENYLMSHPNLTPNSGAQLTSAIDCYWYFCCCWALQMAAACPPKQADDFLQWFDNYLLKLKINS